MQKVSRTLLVAGVLAFGTLTAACGDSGVVTTPTPDVVVSVTVTPANATIPMGQSITLASNVTSTGNVAKTVTWTSSNSAVASVDQTGKVTGVKDGTVTILATSTADASKAGAAAIVVTPVVGPVLPTIAINSVNQGGAPVLLTNANNQIDITVNTSGGGLIEVFLSKSCTTNTISASDTPAATQTASSSQPGTVTLSVNTAAVTTTNAPKFANGDYCIKARLTPGGTQQIVVATNTTAITLNNANVFNATFGFVSQTGGTGLAVGANGLNYREGTMNITLTPVIFTSATPVAQISGYFTRNGEQAGGVTPGNAGFTATTPAAGVFSIAFTDTGSVAGARSLFQYTSLAAGDTLYITAATDAAGNQITVPNNAFAVPSVSGIRVDNDVPLIATTLFTVTAPNGYIGAAYAFSSGVSKTVLNPAPSDSRGGVQGVNTVTSTFYVGAAGSAAFSVANSCDVTGLSAATIGTDLPNTTATNADQAKVVVADKLGNKVCADVPSSFAGGLFGVDKIAPTVNDSLVAGLTPATVAANGQGYAATRNWSFAIADTISGFNATPFRGTITRNFFVPGTSLTADCVVGVYNATPKTCTTPVGGFANALEVTGSTGVNGYYTFSALVVDQAGNTSAVKTATAAFDNVAPVLGALTQSPAALVPLGTVTVAGTATDNLDLAGTKGALTFPLVAPAPFQAVTGTSFGPNFDATTVITGTATVALPNVFRGLQSTTAGNLIQANAVAPVASVTVNDVAGAPSAASTVTIVTNPAGVNNILTMTSVPATTSAIQFFVSGSNPAARAASTTLTIRVLGLSNDPLFQSQPFSQIEIYRLQSGELRLVATNTLASVSDDGANNRTYTFTSTGVALGTGAAGTYTYYAVGRDAGGNAVITQPIAIVNP